MLEFNRFVLEYEERGPWRGVTLAKQESDGVARYYRLSRGRELDLEIASIHWDNGEREVRLARIESAPRRLGRLLHGGRLGVYPAERDLPESLSWIELRVMSYDPVEDWSSAVTCDYLTLSEASGLFVWDVLSEAGATAIGTRETLLRRPGDRRKRTLIATFPETNDYAPVCCWAVTRVLPLLNKFIRSA